MTDKYTPPLGNQVGIDFKEEFGYKLGNQAGLEFAPETGVEIVEIVFSGNAPAFTANIQANHSSYIDGELSADMPSFIASSSGELEFTEGRTVEISGNMPVFTASMDAEHLRAVTIAGSLPAFKLYQELYHGFDIRFPAPVANIQAQTVIDATLKIDAPTFTISAEIAVVVEAEFYAISPAAPTATGQLIWGEEVPKSTIGSDAEKGLPWKRSTSAQESVKSEWIVAPTKEKDTVLPWDSADIRAHEVSMPSETPSEMLIDNALPWGDADIVIKDIAAISDDMLPITTDAVLPWGSADTINEINKMAWKQFVAAVISKQLPWGSFKDKQTNNSFSHGFIGVMPPTEKELVINWGEGTWSRPLLDTSKGVEWDIEPDLPPPRPPQPSIKGVYIYMPTIELHTIPNGDEFGATDVSIASDIDSWAWRFSATLDDPAHLPLLKPDGNGYKEIACEVNGHLFTFLVTGYAPSRAFGKNTVRITGTSRSKVLSEPFAPARSKLITSPYNAAQLAEMELAGTDWSVDWQAQDWLIPGGVYTYENLTPISAIKQLADAIGAIVQTHPSDKEIIVKPRYPVSPHLWDGSVFDKIIPADFMSDISGNFTSKPHYNRAIVSGTDSNGVIVTLTMSGEAGDILTPIATDKFITAREAGMERGRIELAQAGDWQELNFTTWLTQQGIADTLVLPAHLIEIQDGIETFRAQVTGTDIKATVSGDGEIKVRQGVTALRRLSNG